MPLRIAGPLTRLGLLLALLVFALDQFSKIWVLKVLKLGEGASLSVTPFFDLVLAWNKGVSYSFFETDGQWLLVGLSLVISAVLVIWLARQEKPLPAAAIGLIVGGAVGNALDRLVHGAVVDFALLHWKSWSWYVFNFADTAIVAGVALLLYDGLFQGQEHEGNRK